MSIRLKVTCGRARAGDAPVVGASQPACDLPPEAAIAAFCELNTRATVAKSPKSVIGLPSEIGNLPQFGPCRLPLPPATTTRSQTKFKTPWGSSRVTARPHTCACRAACLCGKSVSRPPSLQIKLGGRPLRGPDLPGDWDVRNQRFLPETNLERPPDWCSPSPLHAQTKDVKAFEPPAITSSWRSFALSC